MKIKLSYRISLYVFAILVVGMFVLVYHNLRSHTRLLEEMGLGEAEQLCKAIFTQLHTSMKLGGGREENRAIIERFRGLERVSEIRIIHGPPVDRQYGIEEDESPVDGFERMALRGNYVRRLEKGEHTIARVIMPVFVKKECIQCHNAREGEVNGAISVSVSLEDYEGFIARSSLRFVLMGLGVLGVTSLAVFLALNRRILKPLERLKQGAVHLADGMLEHRVDIKTGDEFEEVGNAFDSMAESLHSVTRKLKSLSERQSRLLEMAPDAIILLDIETRRIIDANPAAEILTGYSRDELLEKTAEDLHPEDKIEQYNSMFRRWVHDGKGYLHDALIKRKDGSMISVEIAAAVVELGDKRYIQEIWRDLSERKGFMAMLKRYVEELEQTVMERTAKLNRSVQELQKAYGKLKSSETRLIQTAKLASLGEMGAGIAHELNSPLAGILSMTEVLMRRIKKDDPNYKLLEKIKDAAVRSKYIILDMLTYARPFKGERSPIYINETIRATLTIFMSELKTSTIDIIENLDPNLPKVNGNKGQLMEVILNIIKNARDAMKGNGKIYISTRTTVCNHREYVVIEIKDTGPGIPDDIKAKIFDPFFTTKEKGGGLNIGLGLSICQSIVREHGGWIEVDSKEGEGTTFRVFLPTTEDEGTNEGRNIKDHP